MTDDYALTRLGEMLTDSPAEAINTLAGRPNPFPNHYEFTHDALVERACQDNEILEHVREGRKIRAITTLRQRGAYGLKEAKEAIEDRRVEEASKAPWVYVVGDSEERDRMEVYLYEQDADDRVQEINARKGEGYAFKDTIKTLGFGQRPTHPHNGI